MYRVGDWYYLVTAEGATELNHVVVVARAGRVTGPHEGCPANPVLTHRHLGTSADISSVGHADLVEATDGTWWAVCLGTRRIDGHHLLGRGTILLPVAWEDDWPVFSPGVGRVTNHVIGPAGSKEFSRGKASYDFRQGARPGPEWLAVRCPATRTPTPVGFLIVDGLLGLRLSHSALDLAVAAMPTAARAAQQACCCVSPRTTRSASSSGQSRAAGTSRQCLAVRYR